MFYVYEAACRFLVSFRLRTKAARTREFGIETRAKSARDLAVSAASASVVGSRARAFAHERNVRSEVVHVRKASGGPE